MVDLLWYVIKSFVHATGFSQWLMTEFLSAEFIRRQFGGHGFFRAEILLKPITWFASLNQKP